MHVHKCASFPHLTFTDNELMEKNHKNWTTQKFPALECTRLCKTDLISMSGLCVHFRGKLKQRTQSNNHRSPAMYIHQIYCESNYSTHMHILLSVVNTKNYRISSFAVSQVQQIHRCWWTGFCILLIIWHGPRVSQTVCFLGHLLTVPTSTTGHVFICSYAHLVKYSM